MTFSTGARHKLLYFVRNCATLLSMENEYEKLVIISSPSGGGKGTLIKKLLDDVDGVWLSVSATSRQPREGETNGKSYYFMSRDEFKESIEQNGFLEWAEYSGNLYGTPRKYIHDHLDNGDVVLLEIEVQGASDVMKKCPGCHSVFIMPPSLEILESRLRGRNTDSEESIRKRMQAAEFELECAEQYEKIIINDDLDVAFKELKEYINRVAD